MQDEISRARDFVGNTGGGRRIEWAEPVPFGEYSPEPFDPKYLGVSVGSFVSEVSKACETPVELAGGVCLAVGAASIQGKIRIETRSRAYRAIMPVCVPSTHKRQ